MRAFETYLNGVRLCLAGVGEKSVLTGMVDYVGGDNGRLHLHVGGLLIPEEVHVSWQDRDLTVGDEISLRIVESKIVDAPEKRIRKDLIKDMQSQKRYVRRMAKKFGWKIHTVRRRP